MSQRSEGTMRRMRRIGLIAGLIVVAGALTGCSSSDSASADRNVEAAAAEAGSDVAFGGAAAPGVDGAQASDRSVIITGTMYMTVENPIAVADQAAGIVQGAGGRIDARNETAPDKNYGGSAALTLRIPSDRLDGVVDELRKLGTVDQFSTNSSDVTTVVTDLEAQISTLRASTARIEGLLADAKDISDIITLENELDGRQAQLQSLEAQQRGLDDQVSMSTIDLSLTTEPVVIVEVDDSPKTFLDGLVSGWNGLVGFVSVALIVVGVLLPWLALMALIAAAIVIPIRASAARKARRAPKPSTAMPPFAGTTNPTAWATPPGTPATATAPAATAPAPETTAP